MKNRILQNLIEIVLKRFKNDNSLKIKMNYSNVELFYIMKYRLYQVFRGLFKKIILKKVGGFLFIGNQVKIEYPNLVEFGKNTILEDGVIINALSQNGIIFGDNVTIAKYAILQCTGIIANKGIGIKIGNNSAVGAQSYLGGQGGIEIGNDVIMGPGVRIFSENHNYQNPDALIRKQGENRKGVKIQNNCWIGASSTILDGVEIGEGSIIAAGSVVTRSISPNSIAAGIPAKVIKNRILENKSI